MIIRIIKKIRRVYIGQKKHFQYFFYKKNWGATGSNKKQMPMLSIFGSCRQDSLYNLYPITSIRDGLSYTHYTKEIIQAIEFCKGLRDDLGEEVFFRSALLNGKPIARKFSDEFEKTDIFVIEIASRIKYEYKGHYIHHEAYDNETYSHTLQGAVNVSTSSDSEIEQDIIKIRKLVHPKKMVVVTHIASKRYGKRYELSELIIGICNKLGIPVIDPFTHIKDNIEEGIFVPNDSERHYTDFGHKIIEKVYKKTIDDCYAGNNDKLIQVYTNDENRNELHSYQGFGDFLMGSAYVNQIAKQLRRTAGVCFNNHPLSSFFYSREYLSHNELGKTKYIFDVPEAIDFHGESLVFTHKKPKKLSSDDKQFLISHCLCPRVDFEKEISDFKNKLNLTNNYKVVHVRGPDEDNIDGTFINKLNKLINKNTFPEQEYLLLSNSQKILDAVKQKNLIKTNLKRCHSGLSNIDTSELRDTLLEFMAMTTSNEILQISIYPWGSNFSNIVSEIFDIPLKKIQI